MQNENISEVEKIARELEAEEKQQEVKQGELITQSEQDEEKKRYEAAMEKAMLAMFGMRTGINKLYPFVAFGETPEQENEFLYAGADKLAHVLKKYSTGEYPEWFIKWKEEIEAGIFFGSAMVTVIMQVRAHNREQEAGQLQLEDKQEGGADDK